MRKNFRKILAMLLVLVMAFGIVPGVFAEDGATDPVYGTQGDFDYAIITTTDGDVYAELVAYNGAAGDVTIPDSFDGTALKVIGHEAFFGLEITSVTIPDGVEVIDSRAFSNCVLLSSVVFPDSIKEIGDYAFNGCYSEIKAKDPDTGAMETVGETGLSFIHMPASLEVIGDFAFFGCELFTGNSMIPSDSAEAEETPVLLFPETLKEIGADAFSQCRSLVSVIIPEGVTDIRNGTFTNCYGLESVEIPSTVTHIGPAFNGAFTSLGTHIENGPKLIIKAPHCIIEDSPEINRHIVVYGAEHSAVQAFVDRLNAALEDNIYVNYDEFVGIDQEIDYYKFEAIEVPGHTFVGTVTVPTCTLRGFTTYVCEECTAAGYYDDAALADLYVPHVCEYTLPLGHSYSAWSTALAPSCEASGSKYRLCVREVTDTAGNVLHDADGNAILCGYRDNRIVPPTGHNYILKSTATCTTGGRSWKECLNCGAKKDFKQQPAYGHRYDYANPDVILSEYIPCDGEGNETSDGRFIYVCPLCGETQEAIQPAHPDANNDHYCDVCDKYIGSSDASPDKDCPCACHVQVGIRAFLYKIRLFLCKLFKVSKVCECGVMHY